MARDGVHQFIVRKKLIFLLFLFYYYYMSASTIDPFRHRVAPPFELNRHQEETLAAILDTFVATLPKEQADDLVEKLKNTHTEEEVRRFCQISSTSIDSISSTIRLINNTVLPAKRIELMKLLSILSTRPGTFALTGYFSEFKNLPFADREKIILGWKNSYVPSLRIIYKSFHALACLPAYKSHIQAFTDAMHYDTKNDTVYEDLPERLPMMSFDEVKDNMYFDVIIVGSGAGGGRLKTDTTEFRFLLLLPRRGCKSVSTSWEISVGD